MLLGIRTNLYYSGLDNASENNPSLSYKLRFKFVSLPTNRMSFFTIKYYQVKNWFDISLLIVSVPTSPWFFARKTKRCTKKKQESSCFLNWMRNSRIISIFVALFIAKPWCLDDKLSSNRFRSFGALQKLRVFYSNFKLYLIIYKLQNFLRFSYLSIKRQLTWFKKIIPNAVKFPKIQLR